MKLDNIKNMFALAATLALFVSPSAQAQFYSDSANPTSIASISVVLSDDAIDACWTNLREVREYAEEKLRQKGYTVVPREGTYSFFISVGAFVNGQGSCIYSVSADIFAANSKDGVVGLHLIGQSSNFGRANKNANKAVINIVQSMIGAM